MVGEHPATIAPWGNQNKNSLPHAIISLGRYVSNQGRLSDSDINRLKLTARRVQDGVKHVLPSGRGMAADIDPRFAEAIKAKEFLIGAGVTAKNIHPDVFARHTWENAINTRKMVEGPLFWLGLSDFEIITSSWHRRAWDIFDHTFGDNYTIRFNGAHDPASPADLLAEKSGDAIAQQIIANTPRGDLKAIELYVSQVMPDAMPVYLPLAA